MSKRSLMTIALVVLAGAFAPLYAQGTGAEAGGEVARWSIITAGFALGIAAFGGALGQGKSIAAACEAIARNPSATGDIRGALILGLVLIESLALYTFAIIFAKVS